MRGQLMIALFKNWRKKGDGPGDDEQDDQAAGNPLRLTPRDAPPPSLPQQAVSSTPPPVMARIERSGPDAAARKRRKLLNRIAIILIVCAAATGLLYVVDLDQDNTPDTWAAAIVVLKELHKNPGNNTALAKLKSVGSRIAKTHANASARSALMAVFALGHLRQGNEQLATATCAYIKREYPDSEFAEIVSAEFSTQCPSCSGKGGSRRKCPRCDVRGSCSKCRGTGKNRPASSLSSSSRGVQKMSSGRCRACGGTGKCPACRGARYMSAACRKCGGRGAVLSSEMVNDHYGKAVEKALNVVSRRHRKAKALHILRQVQSLLHSSATTNSPTTAVQD